MAKGYPDFFGFSMFPYYGPIYEAHDTGTAPSGGSDTIVSVTSKGVLRAGWINCTDTDWDTSSHIDIVADGQTVFQLFFETKPDLDKAYGLRVPMQWTHFSKVSGVFRAHLTVDISFQSSIALEVAQPIGASALTVYGQVFYNLITT